MPSNFYCDLSKTGTTTLHRGPILLFSLYIFLQFWCDLNTKKKNYDAYFIGITRPNRKLKNLKRFFFCNLWKRRSKLSTGSMYLHLLAFILLFHIGHFAQYIPLRKHLLALFFFKGLHNLNFTRLFPYFISKFTNKSVWVTLGW